MSIHSPEFLKKRRRLYRIRLIVAASIVTLLLAASVYVSHQSKFLISDIALVGNSVTSDEEIESLVRGVLAGKYMWIFPRSNELIFPRSELKEVLSREIPRLRSVELGVDGPQVLTVSVEERTPHGLYCEVIVSTSNPEECYFLDEDGLIFSRAPSFSGEVYFLYSKVELPPEPLGHMFMPAEEFRSLGEFTSKLEGLGVELRAFEVQSPADEHHLILSHGGRIMWNASEDLASVSRDLEAFLLDEEVTGQRDFLGKVLYIDLRFENKVFYKFKEE